MIHNPTSDKQRSYITIDAGGTYLKSSVLNEDGTVNALSSFIIESHSGDSKEKIIRGFEKSISHGLSFINEKKAEFCGIGISIPGPFDYQKGISMMTHKFQSLYEMDLKSLIVEAAGINPDLPVLFVHDANAVLYGEQWLGNAQVFENTAVVTLGTGLGFAHSQNKKVQCNDWGSPSISIFKIPYEQGILEDYISKRGFLKIYGEIAGKKSLDDMNVCDIAKLAEDGDIVGLATFREVGRILSKALVGVLTEKKIECLLFAGQISRSFRFMESEIKEGLKDVGSLKRISPVKSIDHAAFYGILRNILNEKSIETTSMQASENSTLRN